METDRHQALTQTESRTLMPGPGSGAGIKVDGGEHQDGAQRSGFRAGWDADVVAVEEFREEPLQERAGRVSP